MEKFAQFITDLSALDWTALFGAILVLSEFTLRLRFHVAKVRAIKEKHKSEEVAKAMLGIDNARAKDIALLSNESNSIREQMCELREDFGIFREAVFSSENNYREKKFFDDKKLEIKKMKSEISETEIKAKNKDGSEETQSVSVTKRRKYKKKKGGTK